MSNRIDYFQPEQTPMTIPAATFAVFVESELCPVLEPKEIILGQWPDFSMARLVYHPSENSVSDYKTIENMFATGKSLSIRVIYNGDAPTNSYVSGYSIFEGQIENSETELNSNNLNVEIIARDFSAVMERITVYGQRIIKDTEGIFLNGYETVFNPDGKANASSTEINIHGKNYKIFSPKTKNAAMWKYADVIYYLLSEYILRGQLHIPSRQRLLSITEKQVVRDLDVTGLNLIDALQRCCERIGLKFKFEPVNQNGIHTQAIVFYKNETGRKVEINLLKSGLINISKSNVVSLRNQKNFQPVTHRFIGQGDFKVYEATFELIKGWSSSLEGNYIDDFSPSTNPNFYQVRDVFRKWTLNEAGDYTSEPYNRGSAFDFSPIFKNSNYTQRRRRFYPCLTTEGQSRTLGYYLQMSYDNGLTWQLYKDAFNILINECGVWLSSDQLNVDMVIASMKNNLKFRITASVISDERLSSVVANGPVNSVVPVIDNVVTLPRQFKYQKVSSESIFAGKKDSQLGPPDEIDDTEALYEFIRHYSKGVSGVIENIEIQTPVLNYNYLPGDIAVSNPDSMDIFSERDRNSLNIIENVHIDFRKQCTNLKISRKRKL